MDVTQSNDAANSANLVLDQVGVKCQKLFQDFLEEWQEDGEGTAEVQEGEDQAKYLKMARKLDKTEHNTLKVSMKVSYVQSRS